MRHERTRNHVLLLDTVASILTETSYFDHLSKSLPEPEIAKSICSAHGFSSYTTATARPRNVYDLILLSTEVDWLEIRLHTLAPYVVFFVVVESPTTFQGRAKPLALTDNWDRFSAFHDKTIHRVVEDGSPSRLIWDHEDWLRNSMLRGVFPGLVGTRFEAAEGDVLVVSDVDEIARPEAMVLLRFCEFPLRMTLRSDFYYSFQWRHRDPHWWAHPEATVYRGDRTLLPNSLRQGLLDEGFLPLAYWRRWRDRGMLLDAGWHCSSCSATIVETRTKLHSFSHQHWDTAENRNLKVMTERVREGRDLFGREDQMYEKIQAQDMDAPAYIAKQKRDEGRFKYLLNRDGEDTGFEDWDTAPEDG